MRYGVLMVMGLALWVPASAGAATYSRCALAERTELERAEHVRTAKGRRELFQWAVRECGGFDRY